MTLKCFAKVAFILFSIATALPTGDALRCFRSASTYSPVQPTSRLHLRRLTQITLGSSTHWNCPVCD